MPLRRYCHHALTGFMRSIISFSLIIHYRDHCDVFFSFARFSIICYNTTCFLFIYVTWLLRHPSLGVTLCFQFLSAGVRCPPPPQRLLLLTSKPFELNLRYLGQSKYRSKKMYWMTFLWPWPKVMAMALVNENLLFCWIMCEPLNQSLQNLVTISLW